MRGAHAFTMRSVREVSAVAGDFETRRRWREHRAQRRLGARQPVGDSEGGEWRQDQLQQEIARLLHVVRLRGVGGYAGAKRKSGVSVLPSKQAGGSGAGGASASA